jgi:hypothetical protein
MIRMGVYGISGVGKTTLTTTCAQNIEGVIRGGESEGISDYFHGNFADFLILSEDRRQEARELSLQKYFSHFIKLSCDILVDAHYSFWVDGVLRRVVPDAAISFYSHIVFYNPSMKDICDRHDKKWGTQKYSNEALSAWTLFERDGLRKLAQERDKSFDEIVDAELDQAVDAIRRIITGSARLTA